MHLPIIDAIAKMTPFKMLDRISGVRIVPLVYHLVGDKQGLNYANKLYRIPSVKEFELELDFILRYYEPIDLEDLIHYLNTGELTGRSKYFFLSFDDGLRHCYEIIAPLLMRKGIPATFFINTGFVDNKAFIHRFWTSMLWYSITRDKTEGLKCKVEKFFGMEFHCRYKAANHVFGLKYDQIETIRNLSAFLNLKTEDELKRMKPYMTQDQILELIKKGFTVGAHSVEHPEFAVLDEKDQLFQAKQSMKQVDELFQPKYRTFAFPFTDFGVHRSFFESLDAQTRPDLTFGCAGLKKDSVPHHIHRIPMDDRYCSAKKRLQYELLYYLMKIPLGKNVINRK